MDTTHDAATAIYEALTAARIKAATPETDDDGTFIPLELEDRKYQIEVFEIR